VCPYCLTKIDASEDTIKKPQQKPIEATALKENPAVDKGKPSGCNYYLGYLSKKDHKHQIPDECLVCRDLVECTRGR
jgi:hypothetical protein